MGTATPLLEGRTQHELEAHELVLLLETDPHEGLTAAEARRRLDDYGPNELPRTASAGPVVRLLRQMHNPLVYVLLGAGLVTLLLGSYVDAGVILGVVAVNTAVGFVQESKAEAALEALRSMVLTEARVVREGRRLVIPSGELVPGDLVVLDAGDKVPADLRLLAESELSADESPLTGESLPVAKDQVSLPSSTPVADRRNMLYSGTFVVSGAGTGVVVATGGDTELGRIHRLVGTAETLATPLTRKLARFSMLLTVVILVLAAVTFGIGVARGEPASEMFTAAVALAVGAIPEGLPAAVTVALAIGVGRMARRRAVVRRLPAVETLGAATVICADKTGTLTENRMTVVLLWTVDGELPVPGGEAVRGAPDLLDADEAARWSVLAGANCNDSRLAQDGSGIGDPTETAMLVAAQRLGVTPQGLPRLDTIPFSSTRQYMATSHRRPDSADGVVLVKGAVERVLERCTGQMHADGSVSPLERDLVLRAAERLARDGMRVLGTAFTLGHANLDPVARGEAMGMTFTGLHAMQDPPRATAAEAVRSCRAAGISVKMITGDHAATATAIARRVGLLAAGDHEQLLTGAELEEIDDEALPAATEKAHVFARVAPEQKLRLVQALQRHGHVVAMTGDGVNDAPALRQADIGIAMGRAGTEVAKEAGDMVLTDDDFATIEAAVEEGRGVFDNLVKFIVWTLPTNTGEALVILAAILLGSALPILPTQILWINMTTAAALGLMLAFEPKEPGIMTRPPRDPRRPLLTGAVVFRTVLVSVLLTAGAWWMFSFERSQGAPMAVSRTAAVNLFVTIEAFYLFSCRSLTRPTWRTGALTNKPLLVGVAIQAVGQVALTYLPVMNDIFGTAPIGATTWLRIFLAASVTALVVAVDKHRLRRRPM